MGAEATSMFDLIHQEESEFDNKDGFAYRTTTAKAEVFHFKVMELRTLEDFEDFDNSLTKANEVKMRFHFFHKMIDFEDMANHDKGMIEQKDSEFQWD